MIQFYCVFYIILENFFDIHKLLYTFLAYNIPVLLSFSGELSSTTVTVDNFDSTDALFSVSSSQVKISFSSSWLDAVNFFDVMLPAAGLSLVLRTIQEENLFAAKLEMLVFHCFPLIYLQRLAQEENVPVCVKKKQGYTQHDNLYPLNTKDLILVHMVKCLTKIYYIWFLRQSARVWFSFPFLA